MSTLDVKPNNKRNLNTFLLPIAALLLLLLALLFMATPLLRGAGVSGRNGFNRSANGQFVPRTGSGITLPGGQNGVPNQGNSTTTGRTLPNRPGISLLRLGFLNGTTGIIVFASLLLVALVAAVGMFLAKRWGQILGIVMGIVYLFLALLLFLPTIILGFTRALNALTLGLDIVRLVLALAVIVLAVIPAKKVTTPPTPATSPVAGA